mmetsp:Transcript_41602/g.100194  ORF Transcript_41602/g.100194 Transcript_41602/m.100194 type:complete len:82 (+) Transcript_41602:235-480(+)
MIVIKTVCHKSFLKIPSRLCAIIKLHSGTDSSRMGMHHTSNNAGRGMVNEIIEKITFVEDVSEPSQCFGVNMVNRRPLHEV